MPQRPTVSVFLGLSLDGYIAGTGDDLSWLMPYSNDPPEETGYAELMRTTDALVMGRRTYDVVANFNPWPYPGKRVIVLTHRPLTPTQPVEISNAPLPQLLETLHQQNARHIYLDGGATIREALQADLVDHLTLSWIPMILGDGVPLFARGLPTSEWKTLSIRKFPSGLVQARFERKK